MKFSYKIKTASGATEKGVREAPDKYSLAHTIKAEGGTIISITPARTGSAFSMDAVNALLTRVSLRDKIHFAKNLAAMIKAGLPLSRALGILVRQSSNQKLKDIVSGVADAITRGQGFADALAEHPKVFSPLFIAMVRAGEESGSLAQSLGIVGSQLEKSYALRKKVRGALIYPAIVFSAMLVIGGLMLVYVVPTLSATFADLGSELPASTRSIIFVSDLLSSHFFSVLAGFVGVVFLLMYARKTATGKRVIDRVVLHIPVISGIVKNFNSAQTTRTISSLLSSGVEMVEALEITEQVMQNSLYKAVLARARERVQRGSPLSEPFKEAQDIYPVFVGEIMEVGEETGKLSEMLLNIAVYYEDEVDAATRDLSTIVEPVMMVVIGGGVGFFALSMITPMYEVMNNI